MNISKKIFQHQLLNWFDTHGRKHLPWQQNKTVYRVWISEIMLQQTQVATVIPYYERFMQQFPDIKKLANASLDQVLTLWAGLGYYSRARNLHQAAKMIMQTFKGKFPDNFDDIITLPGIGASTAGAILSIAFQQPIPILDGNVKRVFARLHGIYEPINSTIGINQLWDIANTYMPNKRTACYTQAIMDLGATICTRTKPNCIICPLKKYCVAYHKQETDVLPIKKAARKIPTKEATFLILKNNHAIFLEKRPTKGIWGGLWSLPEIIGTPNQKMIQQFCETRFKAKINDIIALTPFRHTFTHFHLMIFPMIINLKLKPSQVASDDILWYTPELLKKVALPKPVQTIMSHFL